MKKQGIPKFQMITGGVIEAVREVTITADARVRVTDRVEVMLDPGGSLDRMLRHQFEQGGTFDYRIMMSQSHQFTICNFSAWVASIGTGENEVTVDLVPRTEPTWKRMFKRMTMQECFQELDQAIRELKLALAHSLGLDRLVDALTRLLNRRR